MPKLKPARNLCRAGTGTEEEMAGLSNFEFFKILLPGMYEEALVRWFFLLLARHWQENWHERRDGGFCYYDLR